MFNRHNATSIHAFLFQLLFDFPSLYLPCMWNAETLNIFTITGIYKVQNYNH